MSEEISSVDQDASLVLSSVSVELSDSQKQFLAECEEEFADRYTDNDPDFASHLASSSPPIIDPWYNKPRRNFDWARQHGSDHRRQQHYGGRNERWQNQGGYEQHRQGSRYHDRYRPY